MKPGLSSTNTKLRPLWPTVIVYFLTACGGGGSVHRDFIPPEVPSTPAAQPTQEVAGHGHFLGEAVIEGEVYFVEALITIDGLVRMHLSSFLWDRGMFLAGGGPSDDLLEPEVSMQLVGTTERNEAGASGSGVILGQKCHLTVPGLFCDQPAQAEIRLTPESDGYLDGELRVSGTAGEALWRLNLSAWSIHYPAGGGVMGGRYAEHLAPFRQDGDVMVVDVDAGRMTFESQATGCTGEGLLTPHLDGRFDVHDVILMIESCNGDFSAFNGEFQGLATHTQSGYWDYDTWLVVFLSAPEGPPPRPALTMRSYTAGD